MWKDVSGGRLMEDCGGNKLGAVAEQRGYAVAMLHIVHDRGECAAFRTLSKVVQDWESVEVGEG